MTTKLGWDDIARRYGERQPLPYIAGRHALFDVILQSASDPPAPGRTFLLEGAPGAGKTAFLYALGKSAKESGLDIVSLTSVRDLDDVDNILPDLTLALDPKRPPPTTVTVRKIVEGDARGRFGIKLGGFELGTGLQTGASRDAVSARTLHNIPKSVRELAIQHEKNCAEKPELAARRVLLLIDEAQMLGPESMDTLRQLHGVQGLPVLTVLSGTPRLVEHLRQAGLYRMQKGNHRVIRALSPEDAADAVAGNIEAFAELVGVPLTPDPRHVEAIAAPTDGWPHHITTSLQGLSRAMADTGQTTIDDTIVARAIAEGEMNKNAYYGDRLQHSGMRPVIAEAALEACESHADGYPREELVGERMVQAVEQLTEREARRHFRRHGEDTDQWIATLVNNGILSTDPAKPGRVTVSPIPSMRRYIRKEAG